MAGAGKMSWWLWQNYTIKFIVNKKSDSLVHGIQWHVSTHPVCSVVPGHCRCPVHRDSSGGCQRRGAGHCRVDHSQLFHHVLSGNWEGNVTDLMGGCLRLLDDLWQRRALALSSAFSPFSLQLLQWAQESLSHETLDSTSLLSTIKSVRKW